MFRRTTLIIFITIAAAGSILFHVKYAVIDFEQKNNHVKRSIQETQESLHILKAEWAHLNDPNRLKMLAEKYLPHLKPIRGNQIIHINHVEDISKAKQIDSKISEKKFDYDTKGLDKFLAKSAEEEMSVSKSSPKKVAP